MTTEQEKQLLQAIYDRLYDAITYQPANGANPFKEAETFIHFSKNAGLDRKSFANPRTPSNPGGDLKASEEFSRMVDQISPMALEWENSNAALSKAYESIVNGANATTKPAPENEKRYQKAYDFLHTTVQQKVDPFGDDDKVITIKKNSKEYDEYEQNMEDYVISIMNYRVGYNRYLDNLESSDAAVKGAADRNWQATAPLLEMQIKKAYRKLTVDNSNHVEMALGILNTTINDGIRIAITRAREDIGQDRKFASSLGFPDSWLFSYPSPANWTDDNSLNFTELSISGGSTQLRSKATEHSFKVDASVNYGLWRVKTSAEGSFEHKNRDRKSVV